VRVRRRIRRWAGVCAAYAVLAAGAWGALAAASPNVASGEDLSSERAALERRQMELKTAKAEVAALTRRAELTRELTSHPDWARLLDVAAANAPRGVVFERLELRVSRRGTRGSGATLRLTGVAESRMDASQFAVRLQELGLFDSVSPADTRMRPVAGRSAELVSFSISLEVSDGAGKEAR
jgi:Tfp pilus assembly protein PilN